jgi:hypothetical protein
MGQGVALPIKKRILNGKAEPFRTATAAEPHAIAYVAPDVKEG